jgi:RNA polymerase sigma-70 factor (ECF subfamily)
MFIIIIWTDDDLILLRRRDSKALERLYKEFNNKVYSFLIIKTKGNKDVTDELFSETFYKAIQYAPKLKNAKNLQAWLLQIAKTRFYDYLRSNSKEKNFDDNIKVDSIESGNVTDKVEHKEKFLMFNIAMKNLNDNYREVLELKYIKEKSQKEIAKILGKTETSVESLLFRARTSMKKELKKISKDYF